MNHRIGSFDSLVPAPKDGESPKILELSPPLIAHPIDSSTKKTIGEHIYCVHVRVLQDNEALELSNDYDCTASSVVNVSAEVYTYFMERCFQIFITIPDGIEKYSPIDVMTITVSHKSGFSVSSTLTISYVQRGLIGKTGSIPKPCGYWDANVDYTIKNNMPPLVMYPKSADGLYYLRTENPIRYKLDGKTPMDPAADYASYSGAGAWLLMEGYDALYAHFLMADWARFGNAEGGVFWAHYLFSAMGVLKGGTDSVDYSACESAIFNENTKELTGNWHPNLLLDFKRGKLIGRDVDITGTVNAKNGTIENVVAKNIDVQSGKFTGEIKAESGAIGGFSIGASYLGTDPSSSSSTGCGFSHKAIKYSDGNASVVFGQTSYIAGAPHAYDCLGIIDNGRANTADNAALRVKTSGSTTANYGIQIAVTGGSNTYDFGLHSNAPVVSATYLASSGYSAITAASQELNSKTNPFLFLVKFAGTKVALPRASLVRKRLGLSANATFATRMTIIADVTTTSNGEVLGRAGITGADYDTPALLDNDGATIAKIAIGKGDVIEFMLVNKSSTEYYAFIVNRQTKTE